MDNEKRMDYARELGEERAHVDGANVQENNTKKELKFSVQRREFGSDYPLIRRVVTTKNKFAKMIATLFSSSIKDFDGCVVEPCTELGNQLMLTIYLRPGADSGISGTINGTQMIGGFKNTARTSGGNMGLSGIEAYNMRFKKNRYTLTDEVKELLNPYMMDIKRKQKPSLLGYQMPKDIKKLQVDWDKVAVEMVDSQPQYFGGPYMMNNPYILVKVPYIDLYGLLKLIYGKEDVDGDPVFYRTSLGGVMGQDQILIIEQMKLSDSNRIIDYAGRPVMPGSIYRVRPDDKNV